MLHVIPMILNAKARVRAAKPLTDRALRSVPPAAQEAGEKAAPPPAVQGLSN
ncbi:hypothetical protein GCM10007857_59160 [Bradyrhizobium iriomotense]|uniref:Uncharacterized protein n=1 Tax=Bradyrhizobium iriomotense TaxID=441950 RepID=A0ABQ6B542_9BRAD|nr:hypothetical protein GCM10007857_59160 [Bradyrhizobium iriomotense]